MEAILHVASRVELNSWAMLLRTSAFDVVFRSFTYIQLKVIFDRYILYL